MCVYKCKQSGLEERKETEGKTVTFLREKSIDNVKNENKNKNIHAIYKYGSNNQKNGVRRLKVVTLKSREQLREWSEGSYFIQNVF